MSTTARAGATPGQHTALKLLLQGDVVAVQPADARGAAAETLSVQLSNGQVGVSAWLVWLFGLVRCLLGFDSSWQLHAGPADANGSSSRGTVCAAVKRTGGCVGLVLVCELFWCPLCLN
jgi:hypothetical protein